MKKWTVYVLVLAMVIMTTPLFGAEAFAPGKAHSGFLGASQSGTPRPWYGTYTDYLYLYGASTSYRWLFTGTPTANRTVTVPDATGTMSLDASINISYTAQNGSGNYALAAPYIHYNAISVTDASDAHTLTLASCTPGHVYYVFNNSAGTLTFTGSSAGGTVAANKKAIYVCGSSTTVKEWWEES